MSTSLTFHRKDSTQNLLQGHQNPLESQNNNDELNDRINTGYRAFKKTWFWLFPDDPKNLPEREGLISQYLNGLIEKINEEPLPTRETLIGRLKCEHLSMALAGKTPPIAGEALDHAVNFVASFRARDPFVSPPKPPRKPGMMENLSLAFSYFNADHEPTNPWEALSTLQVYGSILVVPLALTIALDTAIVDDFDLGSNYHRAYLMCGIIGGLTLIKGAVAAYSYFHKVPVQMKPLTNLTEEVRTGRVDPLLGRNHIIQKVFLCWESTTETTRQHPLLVGSAGVGKTAIMTEIARRLVTGDVPESLKSLKKKVVFSGPAASLLPTNAAFETEEKFERFLRRVFPIRKEVILALDEIHTFMNEQYGFRYGELLKSLLDTSSRGLPYMLFATTDVEYRKYILNDAAKARRFFPIYVESLSKEETLLVLHRLVKQQYPGLPVTEVWLEAVYDKSKELSEEFAHLKQPEVAKQVLTRAISKVVLEQTSPRSATMLAQKEQQLAALEEKSFSLAEGLSSEQKSERLQQVANLREEVSQARKTFGLEMEGLTEYKKILAEIDTYGERTVSLAHKIKSTSSKKELDRLKTQFFYLHFYLLPFLQNSRNQLVTKFQIPQLDVGAIDQIIKEVRESSRKAAEKEELPPSTDA